MRAPSVKFSVDNSTLKKNKRSAGFQTCCIAGIQTCKAKSFTATQITPSRLGSRRYGRFGNLRYEGVARLFGPCHCFAVQSFHDDEKNPGLERTRHALRSTGVKAPEDNPLRSGIHTRGYLPHVKREGASYFITFRLADSLPKEILLQFEKERAEKLRQPAKDAGVEEEIKREFLRKVERYLDSGAGACHLRRKEIADLAANTLLHFQGERYVIGEWVVMPNHVHAVLWPMPNHLLSDILKSWKQFISRRAKKIISQGEEPFWQPESFDHWIRNDEEKARISRYIRNNPVTANLCSKPEDWPWSSAGREKMPS